MSRNIKEIGKELMGKSLNSFHRKTGLTQLEENNKMQDGILDGILSQVDDAYIEKTEQSNVIHLDGSGDGVVVLDSIEGNTMVNCITTNIDTNIKFTANGIAKRFEYKVACKGNATYTLVTNITKNTINHNLGLIGWHIETNNRQIIVPNGFVGLFKQSFTTKADIDENWYMDFWQENTEGEIELNNFMVLEGDWTNKEIPASYFTGLQSSFEEKINDEGKYEIEILSQNKNLLKLYDTKNTLSVGGLTIKMLNRNEILINGTSNREHTWVELLYNFQQGTNPQKEKIISLNENVKYTLSSNVISGTVSNLNSISFTIQYQNGEVNTSCKGSNNFKTTFNNSDGAYRLWFYVSQDVTFNNCVISLQLEKGEVKTSYTANKQNKIKLLINEPLRGTGDIKDRLCIKNGKLTVERNYESLILDNTQEYGALSNMALDNTMVFRRNKNINAKNYANHIGDKIPSSTNSLSNVDTEGTYIFDNTLRIRINRNKLSTQDLEGFKTWIASNPIKIVFELAEPYYEEVLNEYGEPILLEGYENGTIYIDSTIVPTTTVRYTPKMESFRTLKEVNNNNVMLTNDVNDNIIPYMMDVDLMIMEKEMALMSQYKIRRIGVKDMTSMQKRTQDMLTRLIKGKTLTEQECKTRVVTYLDAGKITDAQAEELMLLISEAYNI